MEDLIMSYYFKKMREQRKVDCKGTIDAKKGRPSNFTYMKSADINKWLFNLVKNKLKAVITESKTSRVDLLTTEYIRAVK